MGLYLWNSKEAHRVEPEGNIHFANIPTWEFTKNTNQALPQLPLMPFTFTVPSQYPPLNDTTRDARVAADEHGLARQHASEWWGKSQGIHVVLTDLHVRTICQRKPELYNSNGDTYLERASPLPP